MTYLNQFHKEAMERTMRKIEESEKSPMSSSDFAAYMKRNFKTAKEMEAGLKYNGDMYVIDAEIKKTYELWHRLRVKLHIEQLCTGLTNC